LRRRQQIDSARIVPPNMEPSCGQRPAPAQPLFQLGDRATPRRPAEQFPEAQLKLKIVCCNRTRASKFLNGPMNVEVKPENVPGVKPSAARVFRDARFERPSPKDSQTTPTADSFRFAGFITSLFSQPKLRGYFQSPKRSLDQDSNAAIAGLTLAAAETCARSSSEQPAE